MASLLLSILIPTTLSLSNSVTAARASSPILKYAKKLLSLVIITRTLRNSTEEWRYKRIWWFIRTQKLDKEKISKCPWQLSLPSLGKAQTSIENGHHWVTVFQGFCPSFVSCSLVRILVFHLDLSKFYLLLSFYHSPQWLEYDFLSVCLIPDLAPRRGLSYLPSLAPQFVSWEQITLPPPCPIPALQIRDFK